jgi:hypothetical protein
MLKNLAFFLGVFLLLWFYPEIYHGLGNASRMLYQEAENRVKDHVVQIKIVEPLWILPDKFAFLNPGKADLKVELINYDQGFVKSADVGEDGWAEMVGIPKGEYDLNVAPVREYTNTELRRHKERGYSLFDEEELLELSVKEIVVERDSSVTAIWRDAQD